jgi:hypothetical protein
MTSTCESKIKSAAIGAAIGSGGAIVIGASGGTILICAAAGAAISYQLDIGSWKLSLPRADETQYKPHSPVPLVLAVVLSSEDLAPYLQEGKLPQPVRLDIGELLALLNRVRYARVFRTMQHRAATSPINTSRSEDAYIEIEFEGLEELTGVETRFALVERLKASGIREALLVHAQPGIGLALQLKLYRM